MGVDGAPVAKVSLAPPLLVRRVIDELRAATAQPAPARLAAINRAGELFATATLDGETPHDYCQRQARASGVPMQVAKRSLAAMQASTAGLAAALELQRPPTTADWDSAHFEQGVHAVWVPRGQVLGVVAPSNHPMTHVSWLQALALGYRAAVRPGRRDPFTPLRLARALLAAGLDPGHLAVVPGTHASADALVAAADLAIVYGADETVSRYAGSSRVLTRGPGRSKVLVDAELDDDLLDFLVSAVAADSGVRCTNASTLLTRGDHRALANALARRLAHMKARRVDDPRAACPVLPLDQARRLRRWLRDQSGDALDVCAEYNADPDGIVDLGDGSAALRPAVLLSARANQPGFGSELPFPCVWVAPWSIADGVEPLRDSLAVTLVTSNMALVRSALAEPSIRKVFHGRVPPWWSCPDLPHDGYIAHFLCEAKGFATQPARGSMQCN
jgi:acyl-CoA reductase-like NAD-dependent aldehyde dehydrogenase